MKAIFTTILCLALLTSWGCSGITTQSIEEHQAQIESGVQALKDLGVEAWMVYRLPLRVGVHHSTEFGSGGEILGLIRVNPGE